jgi:hypothetical protein
MRKICLLLAVLTLSYLLPGCEKKEVDDDTTVTSNTPPDLCAETDNSDDGILNALLKTWTPVGATFYGNHLPGGCVDTLCPDIAFTFWGDSTYILEMTLLEQDSSGVWELEVVETGLYYVKDGDCRQWGNSWDGYHMEREGIIHCSPDGGDAYELHFKLHQSGVFITYSSRDSTLLLFLQ